MNEEPILRVSCRVVLIDDADRVFLLQHVVDNPAADFSSIWVPPGGCVEPGESFEDAASRELWEEIGLRLGEVGTQVWIRRTTIPFLDGKLYDCVEQFYVCRIGAYEMGEHLNPDEAERTSIIGHKWWSVAAIESSSEVFAPRRLAKLLSPILQGEYPSKPIEVE